MCLCGRGSNAALRLSHTALGSKEAISCAAAGLPPSKHTLAGAEAVADGRPSTAAAQAAGQAESPPADGEAAAAAPGAGGVAAGWVAPSLAEAAEPPLETLASLERRWACLLCLANSLGLYSRGYDLCCPGWAAPPPGEAAEPHTNALADLDRRWARLLCLAGAGIGHKSSSVSLPPNMVELDVGELLQPAVGRGSIPGGSGVDLVHSDGVQGLLRALPQPLLRGGRSGARGRGGA